MARPGKETGHASAEPGTTVPHTATELADAFFSDPHRPAVHKNVQNVYRIFLKDSKLGLKLELLEIGSVCKQDIVSELTVRRLTNACTFLPCGKSRRVGLQRRLG